MRKRIVVTGIGVITANANNKKEFLETLYTGRSGIKKISLFDTSENSFRFMGEIPDFNSPYKGLDRVSQLALFAARSAIEDSGEKWINNNKARTGVVIGTASGGITSHELIMRKWKEKHPASIDEIDEVPFHAIAHRVAREYRCEGPVATITIACASGANAIGFASDLICSDQADIMIAGGSDTISQFTFSGFSILRTMARDVCRPFDKNRTGIVLGEGAGVLILEEYEMARQRGANIYAEILGYGFCNDAYHSTSPDPEGAGLARSIHHALCKASLHPDEIDYVNAHGTGTQVNDAMESSAYKKVFGDCVCNIPISSIKPMIGHTLGAAGAIELIATILSLNNQFVPPTINFITPDPACNLDVVPNQSRSVHLRRALCCNAGFAGNNTAVIVANYH